MDNGELRMDNFNSPFSIVILNLNMDQLLNKTKGDKVIWAIVALLAMVSLLVVYSSTGSAAYKMSNSTESDLFKQIAFIALGIAVIYFAHRVNYAIYSRVALYLFLLAI